MKEKITTGANDRPKDETIAQTGEGLPDDSGSVIEVDSNGVAEIHEQAKETARTSRKVEEGDSGVEASDAPAGGPPD